MRRPRRFTDTLGEGQPPSGEAEQAHQELHHRIAEHGVSEWDVKGTVAFGEVELFLGDGAQALVERAGHHRVASGRVRLRRPTCAA
ncbi:hypothetical protein [Streptomyces sp. 3N207]|uniref:hypothetical protein n=1 Tax=Streptomyces sp. 3N207 TaxID=3457417 RepID=UPI003FD28CB8